MTFNALIRALVLIRFGQELGTDSACARLIAAAIDAIR